MNLLGAHRLVRALGPGMVERQRGDIVFVTSDVVRVPAHRRWPPTSPSKNALEGLARAMQMELEGTGVRVGIVRPGPVEHRAGHHVGPRHRRRPDGRVGALGADAPSGRAPSAGRRPRRRHRRVHPPRHPPHAGRGGARSARRRPPHDRHRHRAASATPRLRRGRPGRHRSPRGAARRPDRADGAHPRRVRRRRHVPPRRQGRRPPHRARGQRDLLPGPGGGPRPGRGLPVHDADLRGGRGVRRLARGAAQGAPQPGPA